MTTKHAFALISILHLLALTAQPARAEFHLMQIEQIIAGVDGDTSVQAIQLRMREVFQNFVAGTSLIAYDATGSNPIELIQFPNSVTNQGIGVRILAASANFAEHTDPALTPDFVLTNLIPASYLAAGSLTFEDLFGGVYWRVSWGGASYTGPNTGFPINDLDGDFGPPVAGPLPSDGVQALLFDGAAVDLSTRNIDDYIVTPAAAEFTNNNGESGTIVGVCDPCDMNCVPPVNALDIEFFIGLLFDNTDPCCGVRGEVGSTGDVNGDGSITAADIEGFINCLFP